MIYGSNILTNLPASWQVTGGSITPEKITLDAGGTASQQVDLAKLKSIPDTLLVVLVSDTYTESFEPTIFASMYVETGTEIYTYTLPVIDTGNGICRLQIPTEVVQHMAFVFSIRTDRAIEVTDWGVYPPVSADVDLTEVMDRLPRLLKDYNTISLTVNHEESLVALISAYITESTELTGTFTLSYYAEASTVIVIRIKDNDISELYTPMLFQLPAGHGTIGIPHGYLNKIKGYHTFTVTAQVLTGTIHIETRQVLYVIDGGRLAIGLMDVGSVVHDITLKKLATEETPSYIYAACIDAGIGLVKRSENTELPGAAWISEAVLGPAIDAAIEFRGVWEVQGDIRVFNTEEDPWVAWITDENILYAKRLNADSTLVQLATGVVKVCSTFGWNDTYNPGVDHGLLLFYIKDDGLVYYRGYCFQEDETYIWEVERNVTEFTGVAVSVSAFRTNDFRVGVNIVDEDNNVMTLISKRNWVGMSVALEHISAGITDISIVVTKIDYHDGYTTEYLTAGITDINVFAGYTGSDNIFVEVMNEDDGTGDWGHVVLFKVQYDMTNLTVSDFVLTDYDGAIYNCLSIERIGILWYRATFNDFNNSSPEGQEVEIECKAIGTLNGAGTDMDAFSSSFVPTNLVPVDIPPPEPEELWNL